MANNEKTPTSASIATTSYDTALCIIPPEDQCGNIDSLRSLYDKGYGCWPPHINVIYPFVAPESLPKAKERIEAAWTHNVSEGDRAFDITLDQAGLFSQRTKSTVFVTESDSTTSQLTSLRQIALTALGQTVTPCTFHLTIGQTEDQTLSSREFLLHKARLLPSLTVSVGRLAILVRDRSQGQDGPSSTMRLWRLIELLRTSRSTKLTFKEFWLSSRHKTSADMDDEEDSDRTSNACSTFNRDVQPGATFEFNTSKGTWIPLQPTKEPIEMPVSVEVSSYNVLVESEHPPAQDRDLLLVATILSRAALSDILVLQEVSDDFLSYLLADTSVRQRYSYTSHGPPSQSDIGPLPSLRNIVVLSRWSFHWEYVPFHRRHKGAIVAVFDAIRTTDSPTGLPLVIAGVHLTSGLTDGSVAAKKVQMQTLRGHLLRKYPSQPWIIAGDFNITTSSYTIDAAIKNKLISQQTANTLMGIEMSMAEAGMHDAWSLARVEAHDMLATDTSNNADDIYEGEEGATFNPRENELAAGTSGTSSNRPQRYDRVLVRSQNVLRVSKFTHFGRPSLAEDARAVPSDHWGIRASFQVVAGSKGSATAELDTIQQSAIRVQVATGSLSDPAAMTSALSAHNMFPSAEEIQGRKEAFALIQDVLLGSSAERVAASGVPLVIVPVGSYALGVWTSTSDIDCLCIGTISSKTFFKLARQRIHPAEHRGIRLLRKVEAHTGTMFELSINGVSMDLQYCPAARVVERWSDFPRLQQSDSIFNLSILSLRKLKPYRDISYIQRTLPSLATFRLAYRFIKLWAVQRGLYSSRFGYLSGIHITLMLSTIYKLMAHNTGFVSAADLVTSFFHHYAQFDWKNTVLFDPFFHKKTPRYQRSTREPLVILGFHAPNANVAHTSSVPGRDTLIKELKLADERLSRDGASWEMFLGEPATGTGSLGLSDFLSGHDSYVRINIQYWGRSLAKGKGLVGWVESRCLLLVVDLNKALPELEVRIWPARFTDTVSAESDTDYQGCYLVGLSRSSDDNSKLSKDDRVSVRQTLDSCFERFQTQLQADERNYDASTCWIGIDLVKQADVKDLLLDDREWGDYTPDLDDDSDDEEEAVEPPTDDDEVNTARKIPVRPLPSSASAPLSSAKLRPASDVLHRLRWDPNLDPNDYIVGYEDRFLGAKEITLEKWKTEQTDDEFIPQHRVLYFKRRGDGVVVWDRAKRIDMIFGSGIGSG